MNRSQGWREPGEASPSGTVPRLRMEGVCKRFGPTRALHEVSFFVQPGEVHALIGENGAGKSTLMKILSGALVADEGRMFLDEVPYAPANPWEARDGGIAMIYQELTLAPHLSVEENILLGREPSRWGWIQSGRRRELARQALAELHHETIPLSVPVFQLTIAEQQIVEIARNLVSRPQVLIMDEPTSSLTQVDTENLFKVIEKLSRNGVSIIYISHFLEECQRVGQRFTVLRDGETVAGGDLDQVNQGDIIHHMVGREVKEIYPQRPRGMGNVLLELREFAGLEKPRAVNLKLREGEILGLAGLVGAGRTETVRAFFGLDRVGGGEAYLDQVRQAQATPAGRLAKGVGLLSENRKEEGLMLDQSLADNLMLTRFKDVTRAGWIRQGAQNAAAEQWIHQLGIKAQGPAQACLNLSGGNQQKIALGRLLHHQARILLLDEPTRGIDVASKAEIYRLMGELASQGKAILFISSYLPELLGVCDTIGVMCRGVLSEVRPASEWTEHEIIGAAIGQAQTENERTE